MADYAKYAKVQLITDYGVFVPLLKSEQFESFAGQQVSIFSLTPETVFTFTGLKYPLKKQKISLWWQGTLNEALGDEFMIEMDEGKALVFRQHL
jgi:thiamine pyrophosphokinase